MGFGRRLAKILMWTSVVGVALAAGAAWFAYALVTDGDTVARLIRAELRRFFPQAEFQFGSVDFRPLRGKASLKHVKAFQRVDGRPFPTIELPFLEVKFNAWRMLQGEQSPSEVVVTQPTLRLIRKRDGRWNLMDLPANPWPNAAIENPPPVDIVNGKIELVVEPDAPPAEGGEAAPSDRPADEILREVTLRIEPTEEGLFQFKGSAKGDLFGKLDLWGSVDPVGGDVELAGRLMDLTISDTLRRRLPDDLAAGFDALALRGGTVDVDLKSLALRPGLPPESRLAYEVEAQLRRGVCECPRLPFPINDLSARVHASDGLLTIVHAEGFNGATRVRAYGGLRMDDPETAPMDVRVEAFDLELDRRLMDATPPEFLELWDVFKPAGKVDVRAHVARAEPGGPVALEATADLRDVSALYRHFKYPLKNLVGTLTLEGRRLTVDLSGPVGDKPARLHGTVDDPGPDAQVDLKVEADSLPIDAQFLGALPPEVRRWVDRFKPEGSVKGDARIFRLPMIGPPPIKDGEVFVGPEFEVGRLAIDSTLDLDPLRCSITWVEMPFPVSNLSGRLKLHPDRWAFENLRGRNGEAVITGSGVVEKLPGPDLPNGDPPLKIEMTLDAQGLPFSEELRLALPEAWRKSWEFINPEGSCDAHAEIAHESGKPEQTRIIISPRAESSVRLVVPKSPGPDVRPGDTIELKMEDALGKFEFLNGKVAMRDVRFSFLNAPVEFPAGTVEVEDSGRFELAVRGLEVRDLLFGANLRRLMPPLMAQFAMRLDDGKSFRARGDIQIGWSGEPGVPAWCQWERTQVFLVDNKIKASIPLEHLNGQFKEVWGRSNGQYLEVHGILDIQSASVLGLQVTQLQGPLVLKNGEARLESLRGRLLGGEVYGEGALTLDQTPRYHGSVRVSAADLQEYARTLPGKQSFRGLVHADVSFKGLGTDFRGLQGKGEGHVVDGDLGELPFLLKLAKDLNPLSPRGGGRSMFDAADIEFRITNGTTYFDQIRLTGSPISLEGSGSRDPFDAIDMKLRVLYGRKSLDVPILSPLIREAGGQLVNVRIKGTLAQPRFEPEIGPRFPLMGDRAGRD